MVEELLRGIGLDESVEPVCVAFTNTVGERHGSGHSEHFESPAHLQRWLVGHRLLGACPDLDGDYLRRALDLREAIYRILSAIGAMRPPDPGDIEVVNAELAEAMGRIEVADSLKWTLAAEDPRERALMIIALSAAALMTSPLSDRIRECANETCGWLFIDHSKNRSRRWCSMSDCGNLAKARRFSQRRRNAKSGNR